MSRLILGNGLLGSELVKQTGWNKIDRSDGFDFTKPYTYESEIVHYDEIINCVAYTNTYDIDRDIHWDVNYKAVADLVDMCNTYNKKLIHISTDYLYSNSKSNASEDDVPVHCDNWYGYTKLLADGYVQLKSDNNLIIRCTHKKEPFPYDKAFINQFGNFDYVSVISELIIKLIKKNVNGVFNVGTELKTMYDLAKRTNLDVEPSSNLIDGSMPYDLTINTDKMKKVLK